MRKEFRDASNMRCLGLNCFWCKGMYLEDHVSVFNVLDPL